VQTEAIAGSQTAFVLPALDVASLEWEASDCPGVSFHWLRRDAETGTATAFIKVLPGYGYADHLHRGGEDCLVLQGSFRDRRGEYQAGDFVYYEPESVHHDLQALGNEACILFVVAHGGVKLLPSEA
jgi:anti-sigma factor ChrR (cupin superfamily)